MAGTPSTPERKQATTGQAVEKAGNALRMAIRRLPETADAEMVTKLKRIALDITEVTLGFQRAELEGE